MTRVFRSAREQLSDDEIDKLVEERDTAYHPEYLKSHIIDENEDLYFKRLRRKFLLAWTLIGNLALIAILFVGFVLERVERGVSLTLAGVLVVSIVVCPILLYRQHKSIRRSELRIRKLNIAQRRNRQDLEGAKQADDLLAEHRRYRDELPEIIAEYRVEANRYRRWHNFLQSIIIIGSVTASAVTTASVSYEEARWVAVGVSAIVGLAAGFSGYFKYRERSFNLQQTADAIEREYESVELRVRRYASMDEKHAYADFANYVEILRDEQAKRQQQLDQPTEPKRDQSP